MNKIQTKNIFAKLRKSQRRSDTRSPHLHVQNYDYPDLQIKTNKSLEALNRKNLVSSFEIKTSAQNYSSNLLGDQRRVNKVRRYEYYQDSLRKIQKYRKAVSSFAQRHQNLFVSKQKLKNLANINTLDMKLDQEKDLSASSFQKRLKIFKKHNQRQFLLNSADNRLSSITYGQYSSCLMGEIKFPFFVRKLESDDRQFSLSLKKKAQIVKKIKQNLKSNKIDKNQPQGLKQVSDYSSAIRKQKNNRKYKLSGIKIDRWQIQNPNSCLPQI